MSKGLGKCIATSISSIESARAIGVRETNTMSARVVTSSARVNRITRNR